MSRIKGGMVTLAVSSALVVGALVGPSVAAAKKVNCVVPNNVLKGTALSGSVSCKGVTKGTIKGKQSGIGTPPVLKIVWTFKGGKVKVHIKNGHIVGSNVIATGAKMTGTGKYKSLKATCKVSGSLTTNKYVFTCK